MLRTTSEKVFISMDYLNTIKEYTSKINEAAVSQDFQACDSYRFLLEKALRAYQNDTVLKEEARTTNFGQLNEIFEDALPQLFKKNRGVVKLITETIKNDPNLLAEFQFYNTLRNFNESHSAKMDADKLLILALGMAQKRVDRKTMVESNKKLSSLLIENGIKPSQVIDEDKKAFYKDCQDLLGKNITLNNMLETRETLTRAGEYIQEHIKPAENKVNVLEMVDSFNKGLKEKLNEDEMSLVKDITDMRSAWGSERKKELFNKFKNECLDKINLMLQENVSDAEKGGLQNLKAQINEKVFKEETIVEDIAKLLEIRDILNEK